MLWLWSAQVRVNTQLMCMCKCVNLHIFCLFAPAITQDKRSLVLWLWRVHNEVNDRLRFIENKYGHSTTGGGVYRRSWGKHLSIAQPKVMLSGHSTTGACVRGEGRAHGCSILAILADTAAGEYVLQVPHIACVVNH